MLWLRNGLDTVSQIATDEDRPALCLKRVKEAAYESLPRRRSCGNDLRG